MKQKWGLNFPENDAFIMVLGMESGALDAGLGALDAGLGALNLRPGALNP